MQLRFMDAHRRFAEQARRRYHEHLPTVATLDAYIAGGGAPVVIVGESGAGKSALAAHLAGRPRADNVFVLDFYAETPSVPEGPLPIVHAVTTALSDRYRIDAPVADDPAGLVGKLPEWLARVHGEQLVLIIDGLDHLTQVGPLETVEDALAWLPRYFPPNVRLIVTAGPGAVADALEARGWRIVPVEPLEPNERLVLVRSIAADQRLSSAFERAVQDDPLFGNPLILGTTVREVLRLQAMGADVRSVELYSELRDLADLVNRVLEGLEADHGKDGVSSILTMLAAVRSGFRPDELRTLVGSDLPFLDDLVERLELYFVRLDDALSIGGGVLRAVVRGRYMDDIGWQDLHNSLGEYFAALKNGPRRAREEPRQWLLASDPDRLKSCIGGIAMVHQLVLGEMQYELLEYWRALGSRSIGMEYRDEVAALVRKRSNRAEGAEMLLALATFLATAGELTEATRTCGQAVAILTAQHGDASSETMAALGRHAALLIESGEFDRADEMVRRVLTYQERALGATHPETIRSLVSLGYLLFRRGEYVPSIMYLRRALHGLERAGARRSVHYADTLKMLAMPLRDDGKMEEASASLAEAVDLAERLLGPDHPELALLKTEWGMLLYVIGERERALKLLLDALEVRLRALGPDHLETGHSYHSLAYLHGERREYEQAVEYYNHALRVHIGALGVQHPDCAIIEQNLGKLLREMGRYDEALRMLREALATFQAILGDRHMHTAVCMGNLGELLCAIGEAPHPESLRDAGVLLRRAHEVLLGLLGAKHPTTANALVRLSLWAYLSGDHPAAAKHASDALSIFDAAGLGRDRRAAIARIYRVRAIISARDRDHPMHQRDDVCRALREAIEVLEGIGEPEEPFLSMAHALLRGIG